jgi:hypothetical protein
VLVILVASALGIPAAYAASATTPDLTKLPLGDQGTATTPTVGKVYVCNSRFNPNGGGAQAAGPWINAAAKTWDATRKTTINGSVRWASTFTQRLVGAAERLSGNGLPSTPTGVFPVATTDSAYQYDRNPNSIKPFTLDVRLPATPKVAAKPTCVGGTIGVSLLGAPIYSAFDATGRDAVAYEIQDRCDGHPERTGQYHFHSLSRCFGTTAAGGDPGLFGYALDGFGIYVERDKVGKLPGSASLDVCHGRTSPVTWHGKKVTMYHYVVTADFPYLVGCYRGTPITTATGLNIGQAATPQSGPPGPPGPLGPLGPLGPPPR